MLPNGADIPQLFAEVASVLSDSDSDSDGRNCSYSIKYSICLLHGRWEMTWVESVGIHSTISGRRVAVERSGPDAAMQ